MKDMYIANVMLEGLGRVWWFVQNVCEISKSRYFVKQFGTYLLCV